MKKFAWGPVSSAPRPSPLHSPVARVATWQALASVVMAVPAGWLTGRHGVVSSLLGGLVNVSAGVVFALLARLGCPTTAAATVHAMIRAEAAKIAVIVLLLWLVLSSYREVVHGAFFAAFVATVLVSQAAILIRD